MAALNLFNYSTIYLLEPDLSKKIDVAQQMAFISFNYFVQTVKRLIPWNAIYEKAIRLTYNGTNPTFDKENPYMDPCGWMARINRSCTSQKLISSRYPNIEI